MLEMESNGSGRFRFDGFLARTSLFYRQMGISKQMKNLECCDKNKEIQDYCLVSNNIIDCGRRI